MLNLRGGTHTHDDEERLKAHISKNRNKFIATEYVPEVVYERSRILVMDGHVRNVYVTEANFVLHGLRYFIDKL